MLGVVLGEWFGAPRGLGVIIISALQNIRIPQMWAAALLCVACSLAAYVLLTLAHRRARRPLFRVAHRHDQVDRHEPVLPLLGPAAPWFCCGTVSCGGTDST